jgi:hypothetical protein
MLPLFSSACHRAQQRLPSMLCLLLTVLPTLPCHRRLYLHHLVMQPPQLFDTWPLVGLMAWQWVFVNSILVFRVCVHVCVCVFSMVFFFTPLADAQDQTWCWGRNDFGQCAVVDAKVIPPHRVPALKGVTTAVAGAESTHAVTRSGELYSWGCVCAN